MTVITKKLPSNIIFVYYFLLLLTIILFLQLLAYLFSRYN